MAVDSLPHGLPGMICTQGQGQDAPSSVPTEGLLVSLDRQPSISSSLHRVVPLMYQIVATGGEVKLQSPLSLSLHTGSSQSGWGGHLQYLTAAGTWRVEKRKRHISVLENEDIQLVLDTFEERMIGEDLVLMNNNLMVVVYLKKQEGTVPLDLCRWDGWSCIWCPWQGTIQGRRTFWQTS